MTSSADSLLMKKICMLGSYAVGKTSLVKRFVEGVFGDRYLTTVGAKIDRKRVTVAGTTMHLVLWDLAGDNGPVEPRLSHLRGAAGYILVADGCRLMTAERAIAIQQRAISISGPVPVVVALNKADLQSDWQIGPTEIQKLKQNGWPCVYTSAKTGDGVEELFLDLAGMILAEMNECTGS